MQLVVITPAGELYNEAVDYIVVSSRNNGDFALLKDHAPLISAIDVGYLKMIRDADTLFTVIVNGALEVQDNVINVVAQEAHVGLNKDSAMEHLEQVREARLEENRKRTRDFLKAEQQLKENVRQAKASKR